MKFFASIEGSGGFEIKKASFERLPAPPANPELGANYFDTIRNCNGIWNGQFWDYPRFQAIPQTSSCNILHKQAILMSNSAVCTITFPLQVFDGMEFQVIDVLGQFGNASRRCTLNFNGKLLRGSGTLLLNKNYTYAGLIFFNGEYFFKDYSYVGI